MEELVNPQEWEDRWEDIQPNREEVLLEYYSECEMNAHLKRYSEREINALLPGDDRNPKGEWKDMNDFKDSWGILTTALHEALCDHVPEHHSFDLHWRTNGVVGHEIRILVYYK